MICHPIRFYSECMYRISSTTPAVTHSSAVAPFPFFPFFPFFTIFAVNRP